MNHSDVEITVTTGAASSGSASGVLKRPREDAGERFASPRDLKPRFGDVCDAVSPRAGGLLPPYPRFAAVSNPWADGAATPCPPLPSCAPRFNKSSFDVTNLCRLKAQQDGGLAARYSSYLANFKSSPKSCCL